MAATAVRGAAVRGVLTPAPEGWSIPDAAERIASQAREYGWWVESEWFQDEKGYQGTYFFLRLGRMLQDGENTAAKGDRWLYHLLWREMTDENGDVRRTRMRIEVSRCFLPSTGKWGDGPSIRLISDVIKRHPDKSRRIPRA